MRWNNEEIVLDYGCGAGSTGYNWILPKVDKFNSKMYSVDVSSKMLAYGQMNYPHQRINYGVGDVLTKFPFENVTFDKIFAVNVFHYIRDIRTALFEFRKLLKLNGQFGFMTALADFGIFQAYKELSESKMWKGYMEDYIQFYPEWSNYPKGQERSGLQDLLESCGFHVSKLEVLQWSFYFDSIDTLLEISLSANPCIDNIPPNLHEPLKEDLRKIFTGHAGIPLESAAVDISFSFVWGILEKVGGGEKSG